MTDSLTDSLKKLLHVEPEHQKLVHQQVEVSSTRTKWKKDFGPAPRNKNILVKRRDGLVTTAYFHWYVEEEEYGWKRIEMWALQDAITDQPLDDDDPTLEGLSWMEIPK